MDLKPCAQCGNNIPRDARDYEKRKFCSVVCSRESFRQGDVQPCGTYGAYQRHRRNSEDPCDACTKAAREYTAGYRDKNPDKLRGEMDMNNARTRALWQLSRMYPGKFRSLVKAELKRGAA